MSGVLSKLKRNSSGRQTPDKAEFPLRDEHDPRVLYVLSNKARRVSLKVKAADRQVHVIVPSLRAFSQAQTFAREQRDWIDVHLEGLPPPMPFVPGAEILFQGDRYRLVSPPGKGRAKIDRAARKIVVPSPDPDSFPGRVRRLMIREARAELEAATHHYAGELGKRVAKVSVRDQASRWGSAITRKGEGHISYSWRLICAPPDILEYVCAHECAHLIEANHSPAFWAVCEGLFPETNKARRWLNKHGGDLHAVGADD
ncbi:metal-dependent hydrolase [Algimonas arctica]|uniref:Metal-dependent hydrolase n=1 Tax=Algimonas arctica TaxID=1479486 RepID=A0A8J3CT65_9PROT|nr:SprT family zinc-dependent metalloprotease [Algimonas arctica]GHA97067.1 metal-dependent hydrolase [Algimonas arctica]